MGIKRFGDYDKTQVYGDLRAAPKGGYVVRILGATVHENSNGQYVIRQINKTFLSVRLKQVFCGV